jgi:predicted transcriptional regulator
MSYFVPPNEVIERYRTREISAIDVAVFAALCSLRREYNGVRVTQERLAFMCWITPKTVSASVHRLYKRGLIKNVIIETRQHWKKYKTTVYRLKDLPESGFFFVPRSIFLHTRITPKMYAVYFFMCKSRHSEYCKSWNSYGDVCDKLGFGKCQRSEVMRLIGSLVERGLITKTVRRIKGVFVDNIYRVCGFDGVFAISGVGCGFTDINNTQKGMNENYLSEKKISRRRE